jgi:putative transposase
VITHRPRRLDDVLYVGYERYHVTTCTHRRAPVFADAAAAAYAIVQLRRSASKHAFALAAYCFMPDHVHLLVYGTSLGSDFRAFVADFKQATGFAHRRATGRLLWQAGYHERVLRSDEQTEVAACYILGNPVRSGLTAAWGEYPHAGSDLFEYKTI